MGAVSDIVNMGSWGRMRMWLLAIAVAITCSAVVPVFKDRKFLASFDHILGGTPWSALSSFATGT